MGAGGVASPMARRWIVLALVLVIAAALAGCGGGSSDPPPPTGSPARTIPPSTLRPATTLRSDLPRQVGTDGDFQVFEVTAAQRELVARNATRVLIRQGLWDQGVRFGITDQFRSRHLVLINPGLSGLTGRQILDRMLRDG